MIGITGRASGRAFVLAGLSLVLAGGLGVKAAASTGSYVHHGATYEGKGRQTHFRRIGDAKNSGFPLKFQVTRSGTRITKLNVYPQLLAYCLRKVSSGEFPHAWDVQSSQLGSARIRGGGLFVTRLQASGGHLVIAGRFRAGGAVSGSIRFHGRLKYNSCTATAVWHAQVVRHSRVEHLVGTTAEGTIVTFERTIEKRPHVLRFRFGYLTTPCGTTSVGTGREVLPPYDEFTITVKQGSFSGTYDTGDQSISIAGHFRANGQVAGTVRYDDRGGCDTGTVTWSAKPAT